MEATYLSGGEAALESKKKPGNPLSKYERRKELTQTKKVIDQKEEISQESNSTNLCAYQAAD